MKLKITFETEIPDSIEYNDAQLREWVNYSVKHSQTINSDNPILKAIGEAEAVSGATYCVRTITPFSAAQIILQRSVKVQTLGTPQETIDRIINDVCQRSGIEKEKILSRSRKKEITAARFACMYLLRKEAFLTFKSIGRIFGRDHTTAIHALSSVENLLDTNDYLMVQNTGSLNKI